jgi:hypothetical protein
MLRVHPWFKELRRIEVLLKVSEDPCGRYTLGFIDSCGVGCVSALYHPREVRKHKAKAIGRKGKLPTEDALVNFLSRHCSTQSKALPNAHLDTQSQKGSTIASLVRI